MDDDDAFPGEFVVDEVPVIDWPRLWRARIARRVHTSDRYRWWALGATLVGLFATGFSITIISVSLSAIAKDLGSTVSGLTWAVTGPMLAMAVSVPLAGKLGDRLGHRRVYLVGFAGFAVFTLLSALSPGPAALTGLRVLAAFGGAATAPTSMAIVMHLFPGDDRVRAMGWWSLVGAGAPVIGLAVGGPVVDVFGWRWIFAIQGGFAVIALVATAIVLRDTPRRGSGRLDTAGALLLASGTVGVLFALQRGGTSGWVQPLVIVPAIAGVMALVAFRGVEHRVEDPLLPPRVVAQHDVRASMLAQFAGNFAYMGSFIITPVLVGERFGFSVGATAAAMACRPLTFSLVSPVAGYMAVGRGERRMGVVGMALVVGSMVGFVGAVALESLALVFVGLVLAGLGMGVGSPSLVSLVGNSVPNADLGAANAAQSMVAQIGVVAGIQILSTVQEQDPWGRGFEVAYLLAAAVAFGGVLAAAWVRTRPGAACAAPGNT